MSIVHVPFYPSDWLAGTRGLSDAETGVYITLIARMYEMAAPIERDDNRMSRLCGCKSRASFVRILEYLISEGKIVTIDGGLFNEKVAKVIQETTEKSLKAKAAAQSRWDRKPNKNNGSYDADASAKHMPQPCQPKPKPYSNDLGKPKSCAFSAFWNEWPFKKAKAAAEKAWAKMNDADRDAALASVRGGWCDQWRAGNPQANPIHPASFLNGKRWTDQQTMELENGNRPNNGKPAQRRSNGLDPALVNIARITGLDQASVGGGGGAGGDGEEIRPVRMGPRPGNASS